MRMEKGQTISEYMLIMLMAVGAITAMTVFFSRTIQGRIFDARNYMANTFISETRQELGDDAFIGNFYLEYEPYYLSSVTDMDQRSDVNRELLPDGQDGTFFRKTVNEETRLQVESDTAAPVFAD